MSEKSYSSDSIEVRYDVKRCIHAAECVRGLPAVFDTAKRPWIQPDQAEADAIAEVIERCPTGALHYTRKDAGPAEAPDATNTLRVEPDGPVYARGDITIEMQGGDLVLRDTRVAFCRCGESKNKPFCDNSHKEAGFQAGDALAANLEKSQTDLSSTGTLVVTQADNGPLLINGEFTLHSADGETLYKGDKTALCRCGASGNKPFCDGTHRRVGFSTA